MANWTKSELRSLMELTEQFPGDWVAVHDGMQGLGHRRSLEACRKKALRLQQDDEEAGEEGVNGAIVEHMPVIFKPQKTRADMAGWRDRFDVALKTREQVLNDKPFLPLAEVTIPTDRPIAILFSADWQLGSLWTDLQLWYYHMNRFLNTKGIYMMIDGDLISNAYVHRSLVPVWEQVLAPEQQKRMAGDLVYEMVSEGKLISVTLSEEHDMREARDVGESTFLEMLRDAEVPLFNNRGLMLLNVGDVTYVISMIHKSRYRSFLNQLHTARREYDLGFPANVVVTAHNHQPAIGIFPWNQELRYVMDLVGGRLKLGGSVLTVACGTYDHNTYAHQGFTTQGNIGELHFGIFYPDEVRMGIARSFDEAERMIAGY